MLDKVIGGVRCCVNALLYFWELLKVKLLH
jgi:hypothetical protein